MGECLSNVKPIGFYYFKFIISFTCHYDVPGFVIKDRQSSAKRQNNLEV